MNATPASRSFVTDFSGATEMVGRDAPQNIDLGMTQPIDIPLGLWLGDSIDES